MSAQKTSKAAEYKKNAVDELVKLIKSHKVIGIINMEGMPAPQLQRMRAQFRGKALIYMSKLRLIKLAFEKSKEPKNELAALEALLRGMPALLLTNENPFKIASAINKSRIPAPAKPGQTATKDIIIPAGSTPFAPGPIISELSSTGLKTGVEAGKVTIKEEFVAARTGDRISPKIADVLMKLGIEPMEVGLNLTAIYEDGMIYGKDILAMDDTMFLGMIRKAAAESTALAVEIKYITKDNIVIMLGKAQIIAESVMASLNLTEAHETQEEAMPEEKTAPKPAETKKEPRAEEKPAAKEEAGTEKPKEYKQGKEEPEAGKHDERLSAHELLKKPKVKGNMGKEEKNIKTKISDDFKEEVKEERERRDRVFEQSTKDVESLTQQLKKKGTLRNNSGG